MSNWIKCSERLPEIKQVEKYSIYLDFLNIKYLLQR